MAKISIILPLYNAQRYVEETLESIQGQTYGDYELICIDDASTDKTPGIIQRFQGQDGRIKVIRNGVRSGAAVSRNKGLHEAKGEYITFLDGDDILMKICCGSHMGK